MWEGSENGPGHQETARERWPQHWGCSSYMATASPRAKQRLLSWATRTVGAPMRERQNECRRCQGVLIKNLPFQMEPKSQQGSQTGLNGQRIPKSAPWLAFHQLCPHCIWVLIAILTTGHSLSQRLENSNTKF